MRRLAAEQERLAAQNRKAVETAKAKTELSNATAALVGASSTPEELRSAAARM